jgi:dipeptidyl aminopeptidase/acylaminoacyl peptidase
VETSGGKPLLDWIAAQLDLDASRVAIIGESYGGHMTLAISTFESDRIKRSIDIVGMSNLVTFLEHTEEYWATCGGWNTAMSAIPTCARFLRRLRR